MRTTEVISYLIDALASDGGGISFVRPTRHQSRG